MPAGITGMSESEWLKSNIYRAIAFSKFRKAPFEVGTFFPALFRFVKSKANFHAFNGFMSIFLRFEYSLTYLLFIGSSKILIEKDISRSDFQAPLFWLPIDTWCNKVMKCVRTYVRMTNVCPTKFSRLHGLPYFFTYGSSASTLLALELR